MKDNPVNSDKLRFRELATKSVSRAGDTGQESASNSMSCEMPDFCITSSVMTCLPYTSYIRIPKLAGTAHCAVTAPQWARNENPRACVVAQFLPTAVRGRGQRRALSPPCYVSFNSEIQDIRKTPHSARAPCGLPLNMACSQKRADRVRPGNLSGIITRLLASFKARVPVGYEDGTGFQYGNETASSFLERPSENETDLTYPSTNARLPK